MEEQLRKSQYLTRPKPLHIDFVLLNESRLKYASSHISEIIHSKLIKHIFLHM